MVTTVFINTGQNWLADRMTQATVTATGWYIGWGTGGSGTGSTATQTNLDLVAAATEARVTATAESQPTADTNRWIGRITAGTAKTIEEAGLFISLTGTASDMIIRGNHAAVTVATGDIVEYTIDLTFNNGAGT